jgi:hypothetical protein
MNRYTFNITVETDKVLNNEGKTEVMEAIKTNIGRIRKLGGHLLVGSKLTVSREVTMTDLAEAMGESTDSQSRERCSYHDEAQGRHRCFNPVVKSAKCEGVCKDYKDSGR